MNILCYIVGHARSGKRARFDDDAGHWRSVCRRCGLRMVRDKEGVWSIARTKAAPDARGGGVGPF